MKSCENLCQAGNSPLPWLTMAAMASPSVHPLPPSRPLESAPGDGVHHRPQTWHWKSNRFYTVDHLWNMFFFHCHVWIPEGKEFHQLFNTHMVPKLKRSNTELGVLGEYWLQGMGFVCIKYDYLFNKWNCSFTSIPLRSYMSPQIRDGIFHGVSLWNKCMANTTNEQNLWPPWPGVWHMEMSTKHGRYAQLPVHIHTNSCSWYCQYHQFHRSSKYHVCFFTCGSIIVCIYIYICICIHAYKYWYVYNAKYVYIYIHTYIHMYVDIYAMRQKFIHSFLDLPNLERWRLPRRDVGLVGPIGPVGPGQGNHLGTRWGPRWILRNWWMDGKSHALG